LTVQQGSIPIAAEPSVHTLGSRVHLISVNRTVDHIERWIEGRNGSCRRVVVSGFHGIWKAHRNARLQAILNSAELWVPDGVAPIWIAYLRGYRNVDRAPGAEIVREFLRRANRKRYRSYFYGDTDSTLSAMQAVVARDYPDHVIAGAFSPPFRPLTHDEDNEIIERINAAQPDVLWVGLGMPKQDIWIYERLDRLRVPVAIGVGAAFAFIAGTVPRCPGWIGRLGFEWVYRFLQEPQKLWRRDLLEGPQFLFHAGLELIRKEPQD
jgi:N-acetylglucosaminyldiphosphoundecaprenol N-acetyl-beta-D-mannosaminyltransferase